MITRTGSNRTLSSCCVPHTKKGTKQEELMLFHSLGGRMKPSFRCFRNIKKGRGYWKEGNTRGDVNNRLTLTRLLFEVDVCPLSDTLETILVAMLSLNARHTNNKLHQPQPCEIPLHRPARLHILPTFNFISSIYLFLQP